MSINLKTGDLGLRKLGRNTIQTLLRQGLSIIFGLGLSIFLARSLGPEGNGQYAMVVLLPTMIATFLNLGVAPANVYHISSGRVTIKSALISSVWLWLILTIIGLLVAILILVAKSETLFPGIPTSLIWVGIVTFPLILLQSYLSSLLHGMQDFKRYNFVTLIVSPITLLLALIFVLILNKSVFGALIAFIGGNIISLLITIIILLPYIRKTKEDTNNKVSDSYTKRCINYGWKAHLSNILTFINYRADLFLVNFFLNPTSTGIYIIAIQIAEKLWILSQSISIVIFPLLSEMHTNEYKRKQLTPLISRWLFLFSSIGAIGMALLASSFINILYGANFAPATSALLWLLPGILVGNVSRVLANDIAARGKPEFNLYAALVVVSINVIANIFLIPLYGIEGAAIATTLAYIVDGIVKLGIYSHVSKNPWWKVILMNNDDWKLFQDVISGIKRDLR